MEMVEIANQPTKLTFFLFYLFSISLHLHFVTKIFCKQIIQNWVILEKKLWFFPLLLLLDECNLRARKKHFFQKNATKGWVDKHKNTGYIFQPD